MKQLIALSGGVDSSVALFLARRKYGTNILGVTLSLSFECSKEYQNDLRNIADAYAVCMNQGVVHRAINAQCEFSSIVIDYFTKEYLAGRTPNPCVICNREIKFGLLAKYADEQNCDKIITGHYARLSEIDGYTYIRKAADLSKDQSYVLAQLSQEQLKRAEFPLGDYTKNEVRAMAARQGFQNAHRQDSQDICFIPDGDYVEFIKKRTCTSPEPGEYVDEQGTVLGTHKGQWCYTVGQRKGLGISMGKYVYVLSKDAKNNRVVLGDEDALFKKCVKITDLHFPSSPNVFDHNEYCTAKLRYGARDAQAQFHRTGETEGILEFATPQRAPSPGQFAVMYKHDLVIASGVIAQD